MGRAFGHDLACGAVTLLTVSGNRVSRTSLYEASVVTKRPLHGYVEPVVRWDRGFRWHPDIGVEIGFDALFWGTGVSPSGGGDLLSIDPSIPQQFRHRVQLLHMLRHDLDDDDDGNAQQHSPDAPQPTPEQQRYEHSR